MGGHGSGKKAKPAALRLLEGDTRKQGKKKHRDETMADPAPKLDKAPPAPEDMPDVARKEWERLAAPLVALGFLTELDLHIFEAYCRSYARWKQAEAFLDKAGDTVYPLKDNNGNVRCLQQFPQVSISRNEMTRCQKYMNELGLTPSSRRKLLQPGDIETKDEDKWSGLIR